MTILSGRAFPLSLAAACLLSICMPASGFADVTVVDRTRINIDIAYDDVKGWDLAAHDEIHDIRYDANQVLFYANPATRRIAPNDPDFAFLGAEPGATIWVLPQRFDPTRLSVGVSTEDIRPGTFASYFESDVRVRSTAPWVKVTLKDVRGPGEVSVWQNDPFGRPILWMATSDGITDDDAVFVISGEDADFNWAFTAPGIYEVDVQASAHLPNEDDPTCSDVVTCTFGVEATNP